MHSRMGEHGQAFGGPSVRGLSPNVVKPQLEIPSQTERRKKKVESGLVFPLPIFLTITIHRLPFAIHHPPSSFPTPPIEHAQGVVHLYLCMSCTLLLHTNHTEVHTVYPFSLSFLVLRCICVSVYLRDQAMCCISPYERNKKKQSLLLKPVAAYCDFSSSCSSSCSTWLACLACPACICVHLSSCSCSCRLSIFFSLLLISLLSCLPHLPPYCSTSQSLLWRPRRSRASRQSVPIFILSDLTKQHMARLAWPFFFFVDQQTQKQDFAGRSRHIYKVDRQSSIV